MLTMSPGCNAHPYHFAPSAADANGASAFSAVAGGGTGGASGSGTSGAQLSGSTSLEAHVEPTGASSASAPESAAPPPAPSCFRRR